MKQTACLKAAPNFEALTVAFERGDVVLVEAQRVSDGELVALLCGTYMDGENMTHFVPLAVIVDENPYEAYRMANPDGGFWPTEKETEDAH